MNQFTANLSLSNILSLYPWRKQGVKKFRKVDGPTSSPKICNSGCHLPSIFEVSGYQTGFGSYVSIIVIGWLKFMILLCILGRRIDYHPGNHVMTSIIVIRKLEYIIIIIFGRRSNYFNGNHVIVSIICIRKLENIIIIILRRRLDFHHGNHVSMSMIGIGELENIIIIILGRGLNYHHGNHVIMSI